MEQSSLAVIPKLRAVPIYFRSQSRSSVRVELVFKAIRAEQFYLSKVYFYRSFFNSHSGTVLMLFCLPMFPLFGSKQRSTYCMVGCWRTEP